MRKASLFLIITLLTVACKKDEDKNAPTITQFKIDGEAIEVSVNAGSAMLVEMGFSDDQELNQYRLEFSDNFSKANGFEPFTFVVVND